MPKKINPNADLQESEDDKKHLEPEETVLELPDVKDIPGQKNIRPPRMNEYVDTTASSADEEGDELFQEDEGSDLD